MRRSPLLLVVLTVLALPVVAGAGTSAQTRFGVLPPAVEQHRLPALDRANCASLRHPERRQAEAARTVRRRLDGPLDASLRASGPTCAGDTVLDMKARALRYGQTWRRAGFTCRSSVAGLRCTNRTRHGFSISRQRSYAF